MTSKENGKSELAFSDNEFDVLEKSLIVLETKDEIFHRLAQYIVCRLDCKFVIFYRDSGASDSRVCHYSERSRNAVNIGAEINERIGANVSRKALFTHSNESFSVPFQFANGDPGYLFIGATLNGLAYTEEQKRILVPIVRILNKTLLYVDAIQMRTEKNRLQYAFSKYVSPEVVNNILEHPDEVHPGGKKEILSVIFTDLQGFTPLSDSMEPEKLVRVLNMYLNEMSQVIISLGGTIDKYEGDAIMAFFGAPLKLEDHAIRCCLAALRMKRMEQVLNEQLLFEKLINTPFFTRFGINTGAMIVGNIGSMQRLDYTIIGSNVNIAARIENCNKEYHTSILISEYTYGLVNEYFECRYVDVAYLKGVKTPVGLYELLKEKIDAIPDYTRYLQNATDSGDGELEEIE
jgi:class 3 adenylate cyclase